MLQINLAGVYNSSPIQNPTTDHGYLVSKEHTTENNTSSIY